MIPKRSLPLLISVILLTTTASAVTLNDYIGTYNIHFNTALPFNSALVMDPVTQQWYSITVTSDTITLNRNLITPDVYLFPTSQDISDIHNIISDGEVSFIEKIDLTWKWYFMDKVWVNS